MKKYLTGLLCALMLTGCQMGNRNNVQDDLNGDTNDIGEDMQNGINDIGEDVRDGVDDITDGIQDTTDDTKDNTNDTNNNDNAFAKTSGPYSIHQPETKLWDVPSFCNSLVGRYYPKSNL